MEYLRKTVPVSGQAYKEIRFMKLTAWSATAFAIFCLTYAVTGNTAENAPRVVASIKPIHALVSAIMIDVGQPQLLMSSTGSPHTYQLKPSGARLVANADVIFWMAPTMESFLEKALKSLPRNARVISLHDAPGVKLLAAPDDHIEQTSGDKKAIDMHAWLDPTNARAMAAHIAAALMAVDSANSATYRANALALDGKLAELDRRLAEVLKPASNLTYIVFHDAYQYFETRYGLENAFAVITNPHRLPGANRISSIRRRIQELGSVCVFVEPQFRPALMNTITENTSARAAVLDPLGAALEPGLDLYFNLLEDMANGFVRCLSNSS
jgi:zinc transport system substrate-binding protein